MTDGAEQDHVALRQIKCPTRFHPVHNGLVPVRPHSVQWCTNFANHFVSRQQCLAQAASGLLPRGGCCWSSQPQAKRGTQGVSPFVHSHPIRLSFPRPLKQPVWVSRNFTTLPILLSAFQSPRLSPIFTPSFSDQKFFARWGRSLISRCCRDMRCTAPRQNGSIVCTLLFLLSFVYGQELTWFVENRRYGPRTSSGPTSTTARCSHDAAAPEMSQKEVKLKKKSAKIQRLCHDAK